MQITFENTLWIIAVLAVTKLVIYSIMVWIPRLLISKDFTVYDVNAYYDGKYVHIFATIKNTENIANWLELYFIWLN